MIYIQTTIAGRGVSHITGFDSRLDFWAYADEVLSRNDVDVNRSDDIATICEKLYDNGIGFGARRHERVSRVDAQELVRRGVAKQGVPF